MTNRPFRNFDFERDIKAVQRIWIECGWIADEDKGRDVVSNFFRSGETEVAVINDDAECAVHWTPGTLQYLEATLPMGAVTAVTTSHIARKSGFAKLLTARSLARQFETGMAVSSLGMFDQGFYDLVGYGTGPYESLIQFDPSTLMVDQPFRVPKRLTIDDYEAIHIAMHNRRKFHGAANLAPPINTKAELQFTENPFGFGYFDGPGGSLSHFIWGDKRDEHGPYEIVARAYQTTEQLRELLALIKSLGDQVSSFVTLEWGEFQFQDLVRQPFRTRRSSRGGKHEYLQQAVAYWQLRMLNLETCLADTHLNGPGIRFNLELTDPLNDILDAETTWQGLSGDYVIELGPESSVRSGKDKQLKTLKASIGAFSRFWLGVRPASNLAITDQFSADDQLLNSLDAAVCLPRPHLGWDF